jgi:hypothetical protein
MQELKAIMNLRTRSHRGIVALAVAALVVCVVSEVEAKPVSADEARHKALIRFVTIPDNKLPEHVRLRKVGGRGTFVRFDTNPAIVTDRRWLEFMTKFFGVKDKAELQAIDVGVVAIYEDDVNEKEIGIWGVYYSDEKAADERFEMLRSRAKRAKVKGRVFPFVQQGRLLLFAWNDSKVSDDDFKAMLKYLEAKKFNDPD